MGASGLLAEEAARSSMISHEWLSTVKIGCGLGSLWKTHLGGIDFSKTEAFLLA